MKKRLSKKERKFLTKREDSRRRNRINDIFFIVLKNMSNHERYRASLGDMKEEFKQFAKGLYRIV